MSRLLPTCRSFVNTWQCDENDHLNVQFFIAFADDAAAALHAEFGLGTARLRAEGLSIRPVEEHIRYHRELRAEDIVEVWSAPVAVDAASMTAYHEIRCGYDGGIAATVRSVTACHGAAGSVPWPAAFVERARAQFVPLPKSAEARSAGRLGSLPDLTLAEAQSAGLYEITRTVVQPEECDASGLLTARHHFARYSDGGAHLWHALGFDRAGMRDRQEGSVVLEMKQVYRRPLAAGSLSVVMSGIADVSDKIMHFTHFMFDAESGALAAKTEAVGVLFDQAARRIKTLSAADRERLQARRARLAFDP